MKRQGKSVLSIDPSIRTMGWAYFENDRLIDHGLLRQTGKGIEKSEWVKRLTLIGDRMVNVVKEKNPDTVVIEQPQIFTSRRGKVALGSEAMGKLYMLVGYLSALIKGYCNTVILVRPSKWKGNVPKSITLKRMKRLYRGVGDINHNIIDAIGIGTWWILKGSRV